MPFVVAPLGLRVDGAEALLLPVLDTPASSRLKPSPFVPACPHTGTSTHDYHLKLARSHPIAPARLHTITTRNRWDYSTVELARDDAEALLLLVPDGLGKTTSVSSRLKSSTFVPARPLTTTRKR